MIYLLAIMVAAFRFGRGPALVAAALLGGGLRLLLRAALLHLQRGARSKHLLTFAMMFGVGSLSAA